MDDINELSNLSLSKSITYLKDGYILSAVVNNVRNYFIYKENGIVVINSSSKYILNVDEFKTLFAKQVFTLVEDDNQLVDELKDKEYYSWGRKK